MRTFHCEHCGNAVFFENSRCTQCGSALGVVPDLLRVTALAPAGDGAWQAATPLAQGRVYRKCANYVEHDVCNWLIPAAEDAAYCAACRLNRIIPNLQRAGFRERWYRLERSKRRLLYSLIRLGLPLVDKRTDPQRGLAFSFMSQQDALPGETILTGHDNGHIVINIDEADPALRERSRVDMQEKYRTLLGHFRHEIGHYYWDLMIPGSADEARFRRTFGDERADYATAIERYYRDGARPGWERHFISRYASAHPWEDWAETWAHYLHIVDTLETAEHYGLRVEHRHPSGRTDRAAPRFDPYRVRDFDPIIEHWTPMTRALNSLNRSMGLSDLYPFVLPPPAIAKLRFVHRLLRDQPRRASGDDATRDRPVVLGAARGWLERLADALRPGA